MVVVVGDGVVAAVVVDVESVVVVEFEFGDVVVEFFSAFFTASPLNILQNILNGNLGLTHLCSIISIILPELLISKNQKHSCHS